MNVTQKVRVFTGREPGHTVLNIAEVGSMLGLKPETVARMLAVHRIPNAWKTGEMGKGQWRVRLEDVRHYQSRPKA